MSAIPARRFLAFIIGTSCTNFLNIILHICDQNPKAAKSAGMHQSSYLRQADTAEMEPLSTGIAADHG